MLSVNLVRLSDPTDVMRLWAHECLRVFSGTVIAICFFLPPHVVLFYDC